LKQKDTAYELSLNQKDKKLVEQIRQDKKGAFEKLFKRYYQQLFLFALRYVPNDEVAEDLVQEMFFNLWNKRHDLFITTSLQSYLYRSVHNQALNYLNHEKVKTVYREKIVNGYKEKLQMEDISYAEIDLEQKVTDFIEQLPDRRRTIFKLSRFEGLKNREIAEKLGISIKTVEAQMTEALRFLSKKLKDYL
jgi:RNA polymerase sigma-70 factor (ECF subfamily)